MKSFGFEYQSYPMPLPVNLLSIGHECQTSKDYYWDGENRPDLNSYVFQYTRSGSGVIRINGECVELTKNLAFFVKIPSSHVYYLPESSKHWEFIYLTFYGPTAKDVFEAVTQKHGHVFELKDTHPTIQLFDFFLNQIHPTIKPSPLKISSFSYQFLVGLLDTLENQPNVEEQPIQRAIEKIEQAYVEDLSVNDLAEVSGLSPYHFIRSFKNVTGYTPIAYLTKTRLQHAVNRLIKTNQSIETIAQAIGYHQANYFTKVFKKQFNMTPSLYRKEKLRLGERHWFTE